MERVAADDHAIVRGAELLRGGGLVAFPTETVYGLGADARNPDAVRAIFAAKGRPVDNPLIVHVGERGLLSLVAGTLTPLAEELTERFWPGPLTVVVDAAEGLPKETTGGLATVAVRMPDHQTALALLHRAGVPVAAPSANRSGRPSPTTAGHVEADLADVAGLILDAGPCHIGVESTVVDARGTVPVMLREGAVTREKLGMPVPASGAADTTAADTNRSPGTRYRHYTPRCRVEIADPGEGSAHSAELARAGARTGLVGPAPGPDEVETVAVAGDAEQLARVLYEALRSADDRALDVLVVEGVPEVGVGRAVMDRLRRAAGAS